MIMNIPLKSYSLIPVKNNLKFENLIFRVINLYLKLHYSGF